MLGVARKLFRLFGLIRQLPEAEPFVDRLRRASRTTLLWLLITELLEIIQIYPLKFFIDGIADGRGRNYLAGVVVVMFGVDVFVRIAANFMHRARHRIDFQQYILLLGYGHTKQMTMDVAWHMEHGTNEKESLIGKNLEKIDNLVSGILYQGIPLTIRVTLTFIVLAIIGPIFCLLAMLCVGGFVIVTGINRPKIRALAQDFHVDWREMNERGTELSTKARSIKQFGIEAAVASEYRHFLESCYQKDVSRNAKWRRIQRRPEYVLMTAFIAMYGLLAYVFSDGSQIGTVVLTSTWVARIFINLYQFREVQRNIDEGTSALDDYIELLSTTPDIRQPDGPIIPPHSRGQISLQQVSFCYPGNCEPTLVDLDLVIEAHTTVALVGPSGGGKSTVVSLLTREVDPTSGQIIIDGVNLRSYNYDYLRQKTVGIVAQDVQLMDMSLADNIRLGWRHAPMELVRQAAERAYADDFITKLPNGYDTRIGENGVRLSGGEKQRIAIARALLRRPKILILDEATSALDAHSQHHIQATVDREIAARESTVIVIAHRLSTVRSADVVVYMEDGRIVERGSHDELMELDGHYAAMVKAEIGQHLD